MTFSQWVVLSRVENHPKHKYAQWLCKCECGTQRIVRSQSLTSGHSKSCGCKKAEYCSRSAKFGEEHWNYKGGRYKTPQGYMKVLAPDHPNAHEKGYALEHVVVMAEHIGRPLKKGEAVHHVNGVRDDNRIENLELWSSSHPSGQRVVDKLSWAEEIIADYSVKSVSSIEFLLSRPLHELRVGY